MILGETASARRWPGPDGWAGHQS